MVKDELLDVATVMFALLNEHESWAEEVEACILTVPLKPFRLARAMVEEPDSPPWRVTVDGSDVMLKSNTKGELAQMFVRVIMVASEKTEFAVPRLLLTVTTWLTSMPDAWSQAKPPEVVWVSSPWAVWRAPDWVSFSKLTVLNAPRTVPGAVRLRLGDPG
jgi:hypothetical protein